ncbi:MAG: Lrp/AsnC family transcriptional regulator [Steroidobacteraceae bacterium]
MRYQPDALDLRLLNLLQGDASLSAVELAAQVNLSQSQCWRRVARLEQAGFVMQRAAVLDRHRLGFDVLVFAHVRYARGARQSLAEFEATVRSFPEVLECHMLMGDVDFLLKIIAQDVASYERFLREKLSSIPAVQEVRSSIALTTVKETGRLPLEQLESALERPA